MIFRFLKFAILVRLRSLSSDKHYTEQIKSNYSSWTFIGWQVIKITFFAAKTSKKSGREKLTSNTCVYIFGMQKSFVCFFIYWINDSVGHLWDRQNRRLRWQWGTIHNQKSNTAQIHHFTYYRWQLNNIISKLNMFHNLYINSSLIV